MGFASILVVAVLLAYLPALQGGLIWNDKDYVTQPALQVAGRPGPDLVRGPGSDTAVLSHAAHGVLDRA